jgi:hypothetical protein
VFTNSIVTAKIGDKEIELFGKRTHLHESPNISFLAEESGEVTLFADGIEMSGFEPQLPMDTAEDCEVAVKFAFGRFSIPTAVGLFIDDSRVSPRFVVRRPAWELTLDGFKESARIIRNIEAIERERRVFEKLKSDFESRVREGIEKLENDEVLKKVTRQDERKQIREVLEEQRLALEAGQVGNVQERKQIVDSVLAQPEKRATEFVRRPISWRLFDEGLESIKRSIENGLADNETVAKYKAAQSWAEDARARQAVLTDTDDPAVVAAEIDSVRETLLAAVATSRKETGGRCDLVPVPEIEDLPLTDEWEPGF